MDWPAEFVYVVGLYRQQVGDWLAGVNEELEDLSWKRGLLSWQLNTNITIEARQALSQFEAVRSETNALLCHQVDRLHLKLLSSSSRRMLGHLCHGGPKLDQQQTEYMRSDTTRRHL